MDNKLKKLLNKHPEEGINQAIDLYGSPVKTICSNILRNYSEDLIEDSIEESFLKLWEYAKNGGKIKTSVKAFLYQIARNTALDMLRKQNNKKDISLNALEEEAGVESLLYSFSNEVEQEFEKKHNEKLLHKVINEMEEPDRSIFILRYFYFYKVKEIAQLYQLKEDNVESRIRRGLKRLGNILTKQGILR